MTHSTLPLFALLPSLVGAILILLTGERHRNLREFWTLAASVTKFAIIWSMLPMVLEGKVLGVEVLEIVPGVGLELKVDAFGLIFALLASGLWIVVSLYSIGYMRGLKEHAQTRYFFCFAMAIFGAVGVALAGNLLTLYLFYEILTVATFPLVAHKETEEAMRAGRKYLAYLLTGATLVLFSIVLTFSLTGTLEFTPGGFLPGAGSKAILSLLFVTYILGFGSKAAVMPIHEWLPSAMVAPTPVSALLHAVAVVKAGVFCVLRVILYVFGPKLLTDLGLWLPLAFFVSVTVIGANLLALAQDHLKRRLAFSTINNLSVIILGAALLSHDAVRGALLHIPFHGFMKITLFMCAGAIYVKTRQDLISTMDGVGRQMPFTMGAFALASAGLCGIPPVCGFISKWYLCLGALEAKEVFFLGVFILSALLDAAYFFPIVYAAFFKSPKHDQIKPHFDDASPWLLVPIGITALGSLVLGLFPNLSLRFFDLAGQVMKAVLAGG